MKKRNITSQILLTIAFIVICVMIIVPFVLVVSVSLSSETDIAKYVALLPVYDEAEEILDDDGELIILKVCEEDGETYLEPIEDDNEFNEIGKIFEERLSELFEFNEEE